MHLLDSQLAQRYPEWFSALADMLREAYDPSGAVLLKVPVSMRDWASDVVTTNNPVAEWLGEALEFTGVKTDRIVFDKATMAALHARFSDDEAGNAVGLTVFKEMLKACMVRKAAWKDTVAIKEDGEFKNYRNVGVGVKLLSV